MQLAKGGCLVSADAPPMPYTHTETDRAAPPASATLFEYSAVAGVLGVVGFVILRIIAAGPAPVPRQALVPPIAALLALIFVIWLLMATVRNVMVALGKASMRYYHQYVAEPPSEEIERPARAFDNLMQLPQIFYAVSLLVMVLDRVDASDVQIAWVFVALRVAHALIILVWNHVPYRFAAYSAGAVALIVFTWRILERCWPA